MSELKNNVALAEKIEAKIATNEESTKFLKTELKKLNAKKEELTAGETFEILQRINPIAAAKAMRALAKKA